ncbi:unnamed protein product [Rodentolepis nana]|uniref:Uncharacterized protein n=1 Tax=Rodentolepis nana TaxID=102285 RepID=A0A3P7RW70_RODNA|nr:unnamed protein product [Rodentolepis nana]
MSTTKLHTNPQFVQPKVTPIVLHNIGMRAFHECMNFLTNCSNIILRIYFHNLYRHQSTVIASLSLIYITICTTSNVSKNSIFCFRIRLFDNLSKVS